MNYKASVITSIFNSELFIEGFMENLLEQEDLESFEVFLLNADSTDDTENLILKHSLPPNVFYQNLKIVNFFSRLPILMKTQRILFLK